ncbi:MAG: ATP phosphoribosyltransferase regulatory subunit [Lachnospiraceae bacterium]|jgi:ATP phosphoribosyltransferase regulatory subunit|nr:ATP phosphoribosyltransferase regulatory subunit [Lachnospiraceae bacterium]
MIKSLLHTPEGVRDIRGAEYAQKLRVEQLIHDRFKLYGYEDVETPTFEFFDLFSREIGTTPAKDLFKFFDREGNTLVLRPDFTPSVARCAARSLSSLAGDNNAVRSQRLCYHGSTFTNTSSLQGKLKEHTEMGIELIDQPGVEADGETIALVIESLLAAGLQEFQISIGQVEYFKGMCADAGLDEETELELRDFIAGKNIFGAEDLLISRGVDELHRNRLLNITDLFGSSSVLTDAEQQADNQRSKEAIMRLKRLYQVLCHYGVEQYISFDLGMLSKYNYYTGVIFKAYAYGVGDVIVKGGRYDLLLEKFGQPAPAIGFVIVIDDLMAALARQHTPIPTEPVVTLTYTQENYAAVLAKAQSRRHRGERVKMQRRE